MTRSAMLPQPSLSFTIPSVYDGTKLDCRLFHPPSLGDPSQPGRPWTGDIALVAHPYAPLGGSFDDPIVDVIAGTLLQLGCLVATFNFRGAASSAGRTSWTSKPEQADYVSVVGFLAYYVHHLGDSSCPARGMGPRQLPTMLLAGYSYGALITMNLPLLDAILTYFATPAIHTAEADIRLRALHLAEMQNAQSISPSSPRRSLGVRLGGDVSNSNRRRDGDNPVSDLHREERIRESVRNLLARAKLVHRKSMHWSSHEEGHEMHHCLDRVEGDIKFRSAYLLVSPPVGLMARLAAFSLPSSLSYPWVRRPRPATDNTPLTSNPTLVIYGGQDGFISYSKMHEWTRRLYSTGASQFHYIEVAEAGHFWAEGDVVYRLRDAVGTFATEFTRLPMDSSPMP